MGMYIKTLEVSGILGAMHGMRNPLMSWDKNDTELILNAQNGEDGHIKYILDTVIGPNDLKLAQRLILGGDEHSKFMRMIHVQADVNMPRYWWSEADTYHFGTKNSESTMHRLLNNPNPITEDMFVRCDEDVLILSDVVNELECLRQQYIRIKEDPDTPDKSKKLNRLLLRAKRLLPEGFLQMRTWDTNYQELRRMYFQRKNHRLKEEWDDVFCQWVKTLPYAYELIMYTGESDIEIKNNKLRDVLNNTKRNQS